MRRALASVQLLAFLTAGAAMVAPGFPRLVHDWSGGTIYPWWALLYVVVGALASAVAALVGAGWWARVLPAVVVVLAGQVVGLGLVAIKHWRPSFGMGGGFAGTLHELVTLAWVIAVAGMVAALAGIGQLVSLRAFPPRPSVPAVLVSVGVGLLVLLALPFGIAESNPELLDAKSLGAFVLIYSGPLGLTAAGAGWLVERLRWAVLAVCAAAAGVSSVDLITDLSFGRGRSALVATAVVLAVFALMVARPGQRGRPARGRAA